VVQAVGVVPLPLQPPHPLHFVFDASEQHSAKVSREGISQALDRYLFNWIRTTSKTRNNVAAVKPGAINDNEARLFAIMPMVMCC
jgi:hypothetical protein